jgi:predicted dehydrogenase
MKWGLLGYGSIGKRHAENIAALKDQVVIVTGVVDCPWPKAPSIQELMVEHKPDLVLVCNETSLHEKSYRILRSLNSKIPLLIEKPLFDQIYEFDADPVAFVAYCMRFHPLVRALKERMSSSKILLARFYVGQYLPSWRPGRNYSETYSAKKSQGGGVLRDLSHELDLAKYLLGNLSLKFSRSGKVSKLKIDSDDLFIGIFSSERCSDIAIEMNYLDRIHRRTLSVFTEDETIEVDFIKGTINTNQNVEVVSFDRNEMYLSMLDHMRREEYSEFATFEEGLEIVSLIAQAEANSL